MTFIIPGKPTGKGRPRFTSRGGFTRSYTPKTTRTYEDLIKTEYINKGGMFYDGAVSIMIMARFILPKSGSKAERERRRQVGCTVKPDCDNISKTVLDALNGLAYADDKCVTKLYVTKEWADRDETVVIIDNA